MAAPFDLVLQVVGVQDRTALERRHQPHALCTLPVLNARPRPRRKSQRNFPSPCRRRCRSRDPRPAWPCPSRTAGRPLPERLASRSSFRVLAAEMPTDPSRRSGPDRPCATFAGEMVGRRRQGAVRALPQRRVGPMELTALVGNVVRRARWPSRRSCNCGTPRP